MGNLPGEAGKLQEYSDKIKSFNDNLKKMREYLKGDQKQQAVGKEGEAGQPGEAAAPSKEQLKEKAAVEGYSQLSAQNVLAKHPTWLIRDLEVTHVEIREGLPTFNIVGKNLSSKPELVPEPMSLEAKPDPQAVEAWKASLSGKKTNGSSNGEKKEEKKGLLDGLIKK